MVEITPHEQATGEAWIPVILLDAWRRAPFSAVRESDRYSLGQSDLPSAAELEALGIKRVMYVVEDAAVVTRVEADIERGLASYVAAGLPTYATDLGSLRYAHGEPDTGGVYCWRIGKPGEPEMQGWALSSNAWQNSTIYQNGAMGRVGRGYARSLSAGTDSLAAGGRALTRDGAVIWPLPSSSSSSAPAPLPEKN